MLIKLSTWSCLEFRTQDEVTIYEVMNDNNSFEMMERINYLGANLT